MASFNSCTMCCTQSCLALCNPMDCGPPGSSVHGTFQARILEWVAISYSRGSSQPRDRTHLLHRQVDSLPLSHLGSPTYQTLNSLSLTHSLLSLSLTHTQTIKQIVRSLTTSKSGAGICTWVCPTSVFQRRLGLEGHYGVCSLTRLLYLRRYLCLTRRGIACSFLSH